MKAPASGLTDASRAEIHCSLQVLHKKEICHEHWRSLMQDLTAEDKEMTEKHCSLYEQQGTVELGLLARYPGSLSGFEERQLLDVGSPAGHMYQLTGR